MSLLLSYGSQTSLRKHTFSKVRTELKSPLHLCPGMPEKKTNALGKKKRCSECKIAIWDKTSQLHPKISSVEVLKGHGKGSEKKAKQTVLSLLSFHLILLWKRKRK